MMHDGKRPKDALAAMVLALLLSLSAVNGKALAKPLYRMSQGEIGFEGFVDEVRSGYTANSPIKKLFYRPQRPLCQADGPPGPQ